LKRLPASITGVVRDTSPEAIRLWTVQPAAVWEALKQQGRLYVDRRNPEFLENVAGYLHAYEWMQEQMSYRIPSYKWHLPWWAYPDPIDLRRFRWHAGSPGRKLVRLELLVSREEVLVSSLGLWDRVLAYDLVPRSRGPGEAEIELSKWYEDLGQNGIANQSGFGKCHDPYPEPWNSRLRGSWGHIFDVDSQGTSETIQAAFECLNLADVVKVSEFLSRRAQAH
jgi:hypothetical protein